MALLVGLPELLLPNIPPLDLDPPLELPPPKKVRHESRTYCFLAFSFMIN